ncbi:mitosis initiation protein fs(1)Ya-like [Musca vetustissima]|uniref:mitosis initiation protein fs(1)Ya-like n=1 Tax=Musca vetustissima TaxID=27455 RepID=UPI002AB6B05A|nr:mitosis initiation protein fs(1)Ya-like [Musca vetustissima]
MINNNNENYDKHGAAIVSSSLAKCGEAAANKASAVTGTDQQQQQQEKPPPYEEIYLFCPICEKRPLPLQSEIYAEMLIHLETHHLPLRCEKCAKMYYNIEDLKEFTKCMRPNELCHSAESTAANQSCYTDEASKVTVTKAGLQSTQISPMRRHDFNDSHMTPISIINMRWKAKSKAHEEFISDSVSSIKNISSISNSSIRRSVGVASAVKGKIIRSTSTPVHLEMVFAKPKEQTFNATGAGHMSSIYNSDSDISPALPQPSSQALEPLNRYRKVGSGRPRMSAVTPLRQVMSKSIQKAFAEHGLPASTAVRGSAAAFQRKKMFDTTSSPGLDGTSGGGAMMPQSPAPPPLDLRLSPAVRRRNSESEDSVHYQHAAADEDRMHRNDLPNMRRKILLSAQKLTTESIVITRTEHMSSVSSASSSSGTSSNGSINSIKPHTSSSSSSNSYHSAGSNSSSGSVFKSCRSVEIITATTEQIQAIQSVDEENVISNPLPPITPITRIPGAVIHKKLIKFETPKLESRESRDSQNSPCDVFFTPNATPIRKSSLTRDRDGSSPEMCNRKRLIPQNLNGRFSPPIRKPTSLKDCAHSTAFSRIENLTDTFDANDDDIEDEVFIADEPVVKQKQSSHQIPDDIKSKQNQSGIWSIMSSVMRLPSRKGSNPSKCSPNNESSMLATTDANSNSIIKRCASIAGSLVRSKPLVDENELSSLKRKRTFTTSEQSTSAYLAQLHNSEATSPTESFNTSSKRFRIQPRRPIDRMRMNS